MRNRATHNNINQLSKAAIRINNKLYKRAIEKRHTIGGRAFGLFSKSSRGGNYRDFIEIDNFQCGRPKHKSKGKEGNSKKKVESTKC